MKLFHTTIFFLLALLLITGCTGVTGNPARPPSPASSGGGCGVAAPVEQSTPLQAFSTHNTPRAVAL